MNNNNKLLACALLSGTLLSNLFVPCFAQYNNYGGNPNSQNYNQSYGNNGNSGSNYNGGGSNYSEANNYGGGSNYGGSNNYNLPPLKGHVVTIPPGTTFPASTQGEISSENLTVGDTVAVMLSNDFYYNGVLAIPGGSSIQGNVVLAQKSGFTDKPGKLKIKFTNAITPSGQRIPLSGKLVTPDGTGILTGGTTGGRVINTAEDAAGGAALGALAGVIMGPLSGGRVGRGAALGTAVGGGLGLGKSLIDRGKQAVLKSGSSVNIVLDQPATINPNMNNNY